MSNNPLVSVVIPTYKRSTYLNRAVESVFNQTYKNIEVIVIDDNDPAGLERKETEQAVFFLMKKYGPFQYLRHSCSKGGAAARNTGIEYAKGTYIAFLDDDDEWQQDKLSEQIVLKDGYDAVTTTLMFVNKDGSLRKCSHFKGSTIGLSDLKKKNLLCFTSALLVKAEVIKKFLFDPALKKYQDWDLYMRMAVAGLNIGIVNEPLVRIFTDNNRPRIANSMQEENFTLEETAMFFDKHKDVLGFWYYKYHRVIHYVTLMAFKRRKMGILKASIKNNGFFMTLYVLLIDKPLEKAQDYFKRWIACE